MTDTSKNPRVFWIKGLTVYQSEPANIGVTLKVIEYGAYQSLKEQCEKLVKAWEIFFKGFELDGVTKKEADIKEQSFNDSLFLARQALENYKKFKEDV